MHIFSNIAGIVTKFKYKLTTIVVFIFNYSMIDPLPLQTINELLQHVPDKFNQQMPYNVLNLAKYIAFEKSKCNKASAQLGIILPGTTHDCAFCLIHSVFMLLQKAYLATGSVLPELRHVVWRTLCVNTLTYILLPYWRTEQYIVWRRKKKTFTL